MFDITREPIDPAVLRARLEGEDSCGAFVSFEGWVRNHNEGRAVEYLIYSVYEELARHQGQHIIEQAKAQFDIHDAICVHRYGRLGIGDMAVWVGVRGGHRDATFKACRFIIDAVKATVPIWKQEFYAGEEAPAWLANPESH